MLKNSLGVQCTKNILLKHAKSNVSTKLNTYFICPLWQKNKLFLSEINFIYFGWQRKYVVAVAYPIPKFMVYVVYMVTLI